MENFICARSLAFPPVQRCRSLAGLASIRRSGESGVALLGDAAHSFPPDLGLGVNSALEDVFLLCSILEQEATVQDGGSIHNALNAHADMRDVDTSALMRMMISGGPYKYGQSVWRARLWRLDMSLRSTLARAFPSIFFPHLYMLRTSDLRFSEIMAKQDTTMRRIIALLLILASIAFAVLVHRS
jgi:kynurenine 3-monooxygenase